MKHNNNEVLKNTIFNKLTPYIDDNYIFLDLPYYTNIGDTLIWKGTEDFLSTLPHKCLYKSAIETYIKPNLSKNVIILVQGGGNFGDLWRRHNDFCLQLIKDFPENKIIILPKSVYYENKKLMEIDAGLMAEHSNLFICARDTVSYNILRAFFFNHILLIPDMAFAISEKKLFRINNGKHRKALFFKRKDKEYKHHDYKKYLSCFEHIEQRDWPSMEIEILPSRILYRLIAINKKMQKRIFFSRLSKLVDLYATHIYMPYLLRVGIKFLGNYEHIFTTRLHGAILGLLLNKHITFFDNSYGKNFNFYKTWLTKAQNITFVK